MNPQDHPLLLVVIAAVGVLLVVSLSPNAALNFGTFIAGQQSLAVDPGQFPKLDSEGFDKRIAKMIKDFIRAPNSADLFNHLKGSPTESNLRTAVDNMRFDICNKAKALQNSAFAGINQIAKKMNSPLVQYGSPLWHAFNAVFLEERRRAGVLQNFIDNFCDPPSGGKFPVPAVSPELVKYVPEIAENGPMPWSVGFGWESWDPFPRHGRPDTKFYPNPTSGFPTFIPVPPPPTPWSVKYADAFYHAAGFVFLSMATALCAYGVIVFGPTVIAGGSAATATIVGKYATLKALVGAPAAAAAIAGTATAQDPANPTVPEFPNMPTISDSELDDLLAEAQADPAAFKAKHLGATDDDIQDNADKICDPTTGGDVVSLPFSNIQLVHPITPPPSASCQELLNYVNLDEDKVKFGDSLDTGKTMDVHIEVPEGIAPETPQGTTIKPVDIMFSSALTDEGAEPTVERLIEGVPIGNDVDVRISFDPGFTWFDFPYTHPCESGPVVITVSFECGSVQFVLTCSVDSATGEPSASVEKDIILPPTFDDLLGPPTTGPPGTPPGGPGTGKEEVSCSAGAAGFDSDTQVCKDDCPEDTATVTYFCVSTPTVCQCEPTIVDPPLEPGGPGLPPTGGFIADPDLFVPLADMVLTTEYSVENQDTLLVKENYPDQSTAEHRFSLNARPMSSFFYDSNGFLEYSSQVVYDGDINDLSSKIIQITDSDGYIADVIQFDVQDRPTRLRVTLPTHSHLTSEQAQFFEYYIGFVYDDNVPDTEYTLVTVHWDLLLPDLETAIANNDQIISYWYQGEEEDVTISPSYQYTVNSYIAYAATQSFGGDGYLLERTEMITYDFLRETLDYFFDPVTGLRLKTRYEADFRIDGTIDEWYEVWYTYDEYGNVLTMTIVTDGGTNVLTFHYSDDGPASLIESVTDSSGDEVPFVFDWDNTYTPGIPYPPSDYVPYASL